MECVFSKRNVIVSIVLTTVSFVACYFICLPERESGVDVGNLAMYAACIGAAIGLVGESVNYITQQPKNATWIGIFGAIIAGVLASQLV